MTTENTINSSATEPTSSESTENESSKEFASDSWDDDEPSETEEEGKEKESTKSEADQTKEAAVKEEVKKAKQRERRLEKLKIDGKEELVDVDQVLRDFAKWKSADAEKREVAKAKQGLEAFHAQFMKDPLAVLNQKNLPINKKELAMKWLEEAVEEAVKDPLQVELEKKDQKLRKYEEQEELSKKQQEEQAATERREGRKQELSKLFSDAMSDSVLAQDPTHSAEALREMAMYARIARQNGEPMPSPEELATHVENTKRVGISNHSSC